MFALHVFADVEILDIYREFQLSRKLFKKIVRKQLCPRTLMLLQYLISGVSEPVGPLRGAPLPDVVPGVGRHVGVLHASQREGIPVLVHIAVLPPPHPHPRIGRDRRYPLGEVTFQTCKVNSHFKVVRAWLYFLYDSLYFLTLAYSLSDNRHV